MRPLVLREEPSGGYLFDPEAGRAMEVSRGTFDYLAACISAPVVACTEASLSALRARALLSGGQLIVDELAQRGIDARTADGAIRLVPMGCSPEALAGDSCAAPKRIYFEITRGCNLRCKSCFNSSGAPLEGELSLGEILDVNRQAHDLGVFEVRYTGGECTRVPGFDQVVRDARARGFYISIGSNGVYDDEQLEWLPEVGIDWFILSLDGDESSNDLVRGRGTYQRVMHTISTLRRVARPPRIRVNMVVAKHNLLQVENVAKICALHGVTEMNLIPLRPYGRSTREMTRDMFQQQDFYVFIREVNRLRALFPEVRFSTTIDLLDPEATTSHDLLVEKRTTCAAGVEACVVGPLGHVYGCSYSPASFPDSDDEEGKRVFIAGSLRQHSLAEIWRDSSRWEVFRNLRKFKHGKCHSCSHYTVRCSGSCQIMAWAQLKHEQAVRAGQRELADFYDPYCFVDLLDQAGHTADLSAPCGGAGIDG